MYRAYRETETRRTRAIAPLGRFLCDRCGLAAVEFALILPVMLTLYFGGVEVTNMLVANRRVTSVAYTAADLAAQAAAISNGDMTDIFAASSAILEPFSISPLTVRSVGSAMTLPAGLTTPGSSVIVTEVTYAYSSPISQIVKDTIGFSETAYLKPRRAVQVARVN